MMDFRFGALPGLVLLLLVSPLTWALDPSPAPGQGSLEARTVDGTLDRLGARWEARPGWAGRWWWSPGSGGSAWVGLGPLQAGPLVVREGPEGLRTWGPDPDLTSGHWGLGLTGPLGGLWGVQGPDSYQVGAQASGSWGPWHLAAGADRTWSLVIPDPGDLPAEPVDRARLGLAFDQGPWSAGAEASLGRGPGIPGPTGRARAAFEAEGRRLALRVRQDEEDGATASAQGAWGPWQASWSAEGRRPRQEVRGGWEAAWGAFEARWAGPGDQGLRVEARGRWAGVSGRVWAQGDREPTGPSARGGVEARGRSGPGRWTLGWTGSPGAGPSGTIDQLWGGTWAEGNLEVEGRWEVRSLGLGWFGPATRFELTLRWLLGGPSAEGATFTNRRRK